MGIKTNELIHLSKVVNTDSFIMDSAADGSGRYTFDDVIKFLRSYFMAMTAGGVPYGKELSDGWAALKTKVQAGNFDGIQIGDYKTITLNGGEKVICEVAGIDQYYKCGSTQIGHHIDFISRDCLSGVVKFNETNTNNGKADTKNPFMASDLYTHLNTEVFAKLPADLQAAIIPKHALVEERYGEAGNLTADSGWSWQNIGNLWLPTEVEVFGTSHWSEPGFGTGGGGCNLQYPIFMGGSKHLIKGNGNGGARDHWWEASARRGSATNVCNVNSDGDALHHAATYEWLCAPLCFRIG